MKFWMDGDLGMLLILSILSLLFYPSSGKIGIFFFFTFISILSIRHI